MEWLATLSIILLRVRLQHASYNISLLTRGVAQASKFNRRLQKRPIFVQKNYFSRAPTGITRSPKQFPGRKKKERARVSKRTATVSEIYYSLRNGWASHAPPSTSTPAVCVHQLFIFTPATQPFPLFVVMDVHTHEMQDRDGIILLKNATAWVVYECACCSHHASFSGRKM